MSRIDVMSQAVLLVVAQTMVLLALSPFIVGLIRKVKARLQCRRGASVFQPYADLAKLFKKQPVVSTTTSWIFTATPYILFASTLAAVFIVTIAETGRVPVDNPATRLDLTMIHEAMILEYSGRYLALVEWASGIRLLVFLTLIVNVFAPWGIATTLTPVAFGVGL